MYEIFHETYNSVTNETSFHIDGIAYRLSNPLYNNISTALRYKFKLPILNRSIALDSFIVHLQGNYNYMVFLLFVLLQRKTYLQGYIKHS